MRIYEQFQKSLSAKENADFLKNEYGWGGAYPCLLYTSGATFEVYKDSNGSGKLDDGDKLLGTLTEKEIGEYGMNDLFYGRYFVKETKARHRHRREGPPKPGHRRTEARRR